MTKNGKVLKCIKRLKKDEHKKMDFNCYEFSYEQKNEGKWKFFKALLLLAYALYTAIYLFLIIKFAFVPLGALIPFTLWIIVYFTWRYTKPEYKYKIESGYLVYSVSYGKRDKEKLRIHIADAKMIAPKSVLDSQKEIVPEKIYSAIPSKSETELYGIAFEKETKVCIFYFKVTRDTIKCLNYYNKSTITQ